MKTLEVIYEDKALIAINKPHGLLVHRSPIAKDAQEFALQLVRNQLGQRVDLIHRLDRKTSGVLLLAKNKAIVKEAQQLFISKEVQKTYHAIVRGHMKESGTLDYDLDHEGKIQTAITNYEPQSYYEINYSSGRYPTSRYSLIHLIPETGRFHQLRKHMAHLRYPIIGDRPHGCNKQNRMWKHALGLDTMLLHAAAIRFTLRGKVYDLRADYSPQFKKALQLLQKLNLAES